jgi:hypothetical protein
MTRDHSGCVHVCKQVPGEGNEAELLCSCSISCAYKVSCASWHGATSRDHSTVCRFAAAQIQGRQRAELGDRVRSSSERGHYLDRSRSAQAPKLAQQQVSVTLVTRL